MTDRPTGSRLYRVAVVFLSAGGELLAISTRCLSYPAARRLERRLRRPDSDVLEAHLYNAKRGVRLPDGVRWARPLDEKPGASVDA